MIKNYLLLLIVFAIITSCQKEISSETVNPVLDDDSTLLSMYVELDTTLLPPNDTLNKISYTYDNSKRLIRKMDQSYFNGTIVPVDSYLLDYYYNLADSLPYKIIEYGEHNITGLPTVRTSFYTYLNGRVASDSTVALNYSTTVHKYTYTSNRVVDSFYTNWNQEITRNYRVVESQIINGFPVSETDTLVRNLNNFPFPSDTTIDNHTFTYDNKNNPFHKFHFLTPFYQLNEFVAVTGTEKRNFLHVKHTRVRPFPDTYEYLYQYQYKPNNYPATVVNIDVNNPGYNSKGIFFYTK